MDKEQRNELDALLYEPMLEKKTLTDILNTDATNSSTDDPTDE